MGIPGNFTSAPASAPAFDGAAVVPNDGTDLAAPARALWIGVGGTVVLDTLEGNTLTITNVPSGAVLPFAAKRVRATGTTATGIVAMF